jgi:uncharacterized protein (TIGR02145 family)
MPDGKMWMTENLNIATASGSYCYGNSADSCAKYGRLYTWEAAKTVCPSGWHLPSRAEWDALSDLAVDGGKLVNYTSGVDTFYYWPGAGKKLKSDAGWYGNGNGTDYYGFSALPGGNRYADGSFVNAGYYGSWWTATEDNAGNAYYRGMRYNYYVSEINFVKGNGFSVRCRGD